MDTRERRGGDREHCDGDEGERGRESVTIKEDLTGGPVRHASHKGLVSRDLGQFGRICDSNFVCEISLNDRDLVVYFARGISELFLYM